MATAPNLVVAGHPGAARKLRETGVFPAVFDVASAAELRDLSKRGLVTPPASFLFVPGFVEDVPGVRIDILANGLAASGHTVLVHRQFTENGAVFDPRVTVASAELPMNELLLVLSRSGSTPRPEPARPAARHALAHPPGSPPAQEPPRWPGPEPGAQPARQQAPWAGPAPGAPEEQELIPGLRPEPAAQNGQSHVNGTHVDQPAAPPAPYDPARPKRGQIVVVASAKGGVGKSSMAVTLALHAARMLRPAGRTGDVVLVDTNFQQADVARYLNIATPNVLDLLRAPSPLSPDTIRHRLAHLPETELYALLGPPEAASADPALVNPNLYLRLFEVLRRSFDYVVVDTPVAEVYHTTFTDLILPEADAIIVPVEPNRVTLESARSWLQAITLPRHSRNGGVDPAKVSLVLNRARADVECGPEEVMDLIPGWRFIGMIPDDPQWQQAANTGQLSSMRPGPDLESTFGLILAAVTNDEAFRSATVRPPVSRWKRLLGLAPR